MWCHFLNSYKLIRSLRLVAVITMLVALTTTLLLASPARAVTSTNRTLSFQGRLLTAAGAVVPDGNYNIQFKIYQDGAGNAVGNPGGSLKWTESHVNNGGTSGVEVRNGSFSVELGSKNQFGASVDWSQDNLWLSMNVAGNNAACSTFGTAPCTPDGEMLPMKKITATPYALQAGNASKLEGLSSSDLIQNTTTPQSGNIAIQSSGAANIGALIQGAPSQSADIIQAKASGVDSPLLSVSSSGSAKFQNSIDSTSGFDVKSASGGSVFAVDTVNSRVGINLTGNNTPTLAGAGLEVQGALRLSGGSDGNNADLYTTPLGASTKTKINIPNYNPGNNSQVIAMGLPLSASSTASVISLYDARTGINQPTLSVFSPNENQYVGFSWDGINTNAKIKTSADNLTLQAGGQDLLTATKTGNDGLLSVGNGAASTAPANFTIQATNSSADGVSGGALTIQGGGATVGNANGGNLTLGGGAGSGTGSNGLVVIKTPTFSTVSDDAFCYTLGANVAADCTISPTTVNSSSAVIVGFSTASKIATVPDPAIRTAGRVLYVMGGNGSQNFTLRMNTGAGAGVEQSIVMSQNITTTLIWNGSDWTPAGGSGITTLQQTYDNTQQVKGSAEILTYNDGLSIRNGNASATNSSLFDVQSSSAAKIFSVNSGTVDYSLNGGAETAGASSSTFANESWGVAGVSTVQRHTTKGPYIQTGNASVKVSSSGAYSGGYNRMNAALKPSQTYSVTMSVRLESGTLNSFGVLYTSDGSNVVSTCKDNITVSTTEWTKVQCTFETPASGINSDNTIAFGQLGAGAFTYYVDDLSITESSTLNGGGGSTPNVQIGTGQGGGDSTTLFTLDKSASPPTAINGDALLGSMYYDTTVGKVQCYESEGWGACGSSPDTFVTISPEYTNAVTNGSGIGTMTTDLCSDALNINDGSSAQPTICGANETFNFYNWKSAQTTAQTKSIYVTYKLPSNFKKFAAGTTTLMGRTDSNNSTVNYQVYRNNDNAGLTPCGSTVAVSTGVQSTWKSATATGTADPSNCNFTAGDSIVVRVNMIANNNANAYISNLGFTFTNQ